MGQGNEKNASLSGHLFAWLQLSARATGTKSQDRNRVGKRRHRLATSLGARRCAGGAGLREGIGDAAAGQSRRESREIDC